MYKYLSSPGAKYEINMYVCTNVGLVEKTFGIRVLGAALWGTFRF